MAKKDRRFKCDRMLALLLVAVMLTCSWAVSVHAAGDDSSCGTANSTASESGSAVSEASGMVFSSGSESGGTQSAAESSAPVSSSEEAIPSAASSSAPEQSSAPEPSSDPVPALKQQKLAGTIYTDETLAKKSDDKTVIAVTGELPEGAAVKAYPVKVKIGDAAVLAAYDITIYTADGSVFQPDESVKVSIRAPKLKDAGPVDVYHVVEDETAQTGEDKAVRTAGEKESGAAAQSGGKAETDSAEQDEEAGQAVVEQNGGTKIMKAAKVAEGVKPQSEAVEFQADSFSIYVVTGSHWYDRIKIENGGNYEIKVGDTVTLYDDNAGGKWSVNDDSVVHLSQDWNDEYGTYTTVNGLKAGTATITCQYVWWEYGWRYEQADTITITVQGADELHPVDTVDSWSKGIRLAMFDYDYDTKNSFSILNPNPDGSLDSRERYGNGATKTGLLRPVVESDGFPNTVTNQPMSSWFTKNGLYVSGTYQPANHLFLKSVYDATGYFHYSSAENFAAFNGSKDTDGVKDFTLYRELGTPSSNNAFYYQRGNFLPYNTINSMKKSTNTNQYDLNGNPLTGSTKGLPLYVPDQAVDYHFGMYMTADFIQPKNGQVVKPGGTAKEDMVFKFTGDDDMWVYLDGVLALDLGGIHDAQSGAIDFHTGVITWTNTPTNRSKVTETTSIQAMLDAAVQNYGSKISRSGAQGSPAITYTVRQGTKTTGIVLKKTADGKGYTFADDSKHTIQMFYMERGAGASNLSVDFNLPTIPKDSVSVTKAVEGLNDYWTKNQTYRMKLYVENASGSGTYSVWKDDYKIGDTPHSTDGDGTFTLKNGQTAVFPGIPADRNYYVEEQKPDDGISYQVQFNEETEQNFSGSSNSVKSAPVSAENTPSMTVTNTAQNIGSLTVAKKLDGFPDGQTFAANFNLWKVKTEAEGADTLIETVSYSGFTDPGGGGDKTYTFTGLPPGTYYVMETDPTGVNGYLLTTTYTVGNAAKDTGSTATVVLTGENNGAILVTNTYAGYTLPVTGGAGTLLFRIVGAVILIGAAVGLGFYLTRNKRKKGGTPKE